jgi:hypothetical protein
LLSSVLDFRFSYIPIAELVTFMINGGAGSSIVEVDGPGPAP